MSNAQTFFGSCIAALKAHEAYTHSPTDDVRKLVDGRSTTYQFTISTAGEILDNGLDTDLTLQILQHLPQKQVMRFVQCLNATNQGLITKWDKTHARIILALYANAKGTRTTQLARVAGNLRKGTDDTDQALRERVNALFKGNHDITTVLSKLSNFAGKNGYAQTLALTQSEGFGHNRVVHLNETAPLIRKFLGQVAKASDGQLRELMGE
jgi:hypothetical protein